MNEVLRFRRNVYLKKKKYIHTIQMTMIAHIYVLMYMYVSVIVAVVCHTICSQVLLQAVKKIIKVQVFL